MEKILIALKYFYEKNGKDVSFKIGELRCMFTVLKEQEIFFDYDIYDFVKEDYSDLVFVYATETEISLCQENSVEVVPDFQYVHFFGDKINQNDFDFEMEIEELIIRIYESENLKNKLEKELILNTVRKKLNKI